MPRGNAEGRVALGRDRTAESSQYDTVKAQGTSPVIRYRNLPCNPGNANDFYPRSYRNGKANWSRAERICGQCPLQIKTECLAWALETTQQFGFWGGTTPQQRRRIRQRGWTATDVYGS